MKRPLAKGRPRSTTPDHRRSKPSGCTRARWPSGRGSRGPALIRDSVAALRWRGASQKSMLKPFSYWGFPRRNLGSGSSANLPVPRVKAAVKPLAALLEQRAAVREQEHWLGLPETPRRGRNKPEKRRELPMGVRQKLNSPYVCRWGIITAGTGLTFQSWSVFAIGILPGAVLKFYDGGIRTASRSRCSERRWRIPSIPNRFTLG